MIIIGSSVFQRVDGKDLYKLLIKFSQRFINREAHWNGFNILHKEVTSIGALEIGIKLFNEENIDPNKKPKLVYLMNYDEFRDYEIPSDAYVIYQGTHGDKGAERANLILPGATYMEKSGTYVSTTGKVDISRVSATIPFLAKEDWEIIRALSEFMDLTLPYNEIYDIRNRMCELAPYLVKYDYIEPHGFENLLHEIYKNDKIVINNSNFVDTIDVKFK